MKENLFLTLFRPFFLTSKETHRESIVKRQKNEKLLLKFNLRKFSRRVEMETFQS